MWIRPESTVEMEASYFFPFFSIQIIHSLFKVGNTEWNKKVSIVPDLIFCFKWDKYVDVKVRVWFYFWIFQTGDVMKVVDHSWGFKYNEWHEKPLVLKSFLFRHFRYDHVDVVLKKARRQTLRSTEMSFSLPRTLNFAVKIKFLFQFRFLQTLFRMKFDQY